MPFRLYPLWPVMMLKWLNKELGGFTTWGKVCYILGLICLIGAAGWWLAVLYQMFSSFYQYTGLQLLFLPLVKFIANPFLALSLIFFKLAKRV